MKNLLFIVLNISALFWIPLEGITAQTVRQIKVPDLEKLLTSTDNRLFVINFWATWCPPCVKELPHFQKVSEDLKRENIEFIFVSLDFPSQIESHLKPFLIRNKIYSPVSVMMDTDYDKWIGSVDQSWQGNIPATLFLNNIRGIRKFHADELNENELLTIIKPLL